MRLSFCLLLSVALGTTPSPSEGLVVSAAAESPTTTSTGDPSEFSIPDGMTEFVATDGVTLAYRSWPAEKPRGMMYVVHGMAEHSGRYADFAVELARDLGLTVIGIDQRAHGLTAGAALGVFAKGDHHHSDAISVMGHDILELISVTNKNQLPVILFGHSMGSVIARSAMKQAGSGIAKLIKGLVLSGVPTGPHWRELYPVRMAGEVVKRTGVGHDLIQRAYTKLWFDQPVRTKLSDGSLPDNCFVSSDPEECRIFTRDPLTNHLVDPEILVSVALNLRELERATSFGSRDIPVLFVTGRDDPVARFGATARADADRMIKAGHHVSEIYLSGARHEFLHEKERVRREGVGLVKAWIFSQLL